MRRRTAQERVKRLRERDLRKVCEPIRRRCARWAADHTRTLEAADPSLPEELTDRQQDNWAPLVAIADEVGGVWPKDARQASLVLSGVRPDQDDQIGVELLADIKTVFDGQHDENALSSAKIVNELTAMEERPWAAYGRQEKPLTPQKLAKLLRPFGIVPSGDIRFPGGVKKGYRRASFEDAWTRYLDDEPRHRNKPNDDGLQLSFSERNTAEAVAVAKQEVQPIDTATCCDVAVGDASQGHVAGPSEDGRDQV